MGARGGGYSDKLLRMLSRTSSAGYVNFAFLKITTPTVFTRDLNHGPSDLKPSALPLC